MTDVTVGGVGELVGIGEGVIVGHEECNIEACPKRWSPGPGVEVENEAGAKLWAIWMLSRMMVDWGWNRCR